MSEACSRGWHFRMPLKTTIGLTWWGRVMDCHRLCLLNCQCCYIHELVSVSERLECLVYSVVCFIYFLSKLFQYFSACSYRFWIGLYYNTLAKTWVCPESFGRGYACTRGACIIRGECLPAFLACKVGGLKILSYEYQYYFSAKTVQERGEPYWCATQKQCNHKPIEYWITL